VGKARKREGGGMKERKERKLKVNFRLLHFK
jgi:hypothetical protein